MAAARKALRTASAVVLLAGALSGSSAARDGGGAERQSLALELAAARTQNDPLRRAQLEADIFWRARDFPRVLAVAAEGLEHAPDDLLLLWRAAGAALWLQDGGSALAWTMRMESAVRAGDLDAEQRAGWVDEARSHAEQARALVELSEAGAVALRRSRHAVAVMSALCLILLALGARAPARLSASRPAVHVAPGYKKTARPEEIRPGGGAS
jgi:hypothetical protein